MLISFIFLSCWTQVIEGTSCDIPSVNIESLPEIDIANSHSFITEERTYSLQESIPIVYRSKQKSIYCELGYENEYRKKMLLKDKDLSSNFCFLKSEDNKAFIAECEASHLKLYEINDSLSLKHEFPLTYNGEKEPISFLLEKSTDNESALDFVWSVSYDGVVCSTLKDTWAKKTGSSFKVYEKNALGYDVKDRAKVFTYKKEKSIFRIFNGRIGVISGKAWDVKSLEGEEWDYKENGDIYPEKERHINSNLLNIIEHGLLRDYPQNVSKARTKDIYLEDKFPSIVLDDMTMIKTISNKRGIFSYFISSYSLYIMRAEYYASNGFEDLVIKDIAKVLEGEPKTIGSLLYNEKFNMLFLTYLEVTGKVFIHLFDLSSDKLDINCKIEVATSHFNKIKKPNNIPMSPRLALVNINDDLIVKAFYTDRGPKVKMKEYKLSRSKRIESSFEIPFSKEELVFLLTMSFSINILFYLHCTNTQIEKKDYEVTTKDTNTVSNNKESTITKEKSTNRKEVTKHNRSINKRDEANEDSDEEKAQIKEDRLKIKSRNNNAISNNMYNGLPMSDAEDEDDKDLYDNRDYPANHCSYGGMISSIDSLPDRELSKQSSEEWEIVERRGKNKQKSPQRNRKYKSDINNSDEESKHSSKIAEENYADLNDCVEMPNNPKALQQSSSSSQNKDVSNRLQNNKDEENKHLYEEIPVTPNNSRDRSSSSINEDRRSPEDDHKSTAKRTFGALFGRKKTKNIGQRSDERLKK